MRILVAAALVACGHVAPSNGDDVAPTPKDARAKDAPDVIDGRVPIVDEVTCETHTRTEARANGDKFETITRYALIALIAGIAPTDDYRIEQCDLILNGQPFPAPGTGPCPTGSTCSDTGTPQPAVRCFWSNGNGSFAADGRLIVTCGNGSRATNAAGMVTSQSDFSYSTIRVHR